MGNVAGKMSLCLAFSRKMRYTVECKYGEKGGVCMSDEIIAGIIGAAGAIIAALIPEIIRASPRTKQRILVSIGAALACVALFFGSREFYRLYQERRLTDQPLVQTIRETLSTGGYHTVGLCKDGTVIAVGNNGYGQCDVADWRDIVAVRWMVLHGRTAQRRRSYRRLFLRIMSLMSNSM